MSTTITRERPDTPDAVALILELEAELDPLYPRTSRHGYSVDKLIAQGVIFFVVRSGGRLRRRPAFRRGIWRTQTDVCAPGVPRPGNRETVAGPA